MKLSEEIKDILRFTSIDVNDLTYLAKNIKELESQIESMKRCGNCQHHLLKNVTTRCVDCDDFNLWQLK